MSKIKNTHETSVRMQKALQEHFVVYDLVSEKLANAHEPLREELKKEGTLGAIEITDDDIVIHWQNNQGDSFLLNMELADYLEEKFGIVAEYATTSNISVIKRNSYKPERITALENETKKLQQEKPMATGFATREKPPIISYASANTFDERNKAWGAGVGKGRI